MSSWQPLHIAIPAIERALEEAALVVIDEVAPMELQSPGFVRVVARALASFRLR